MNRMNRYILFSLRKFELYFPPYCTDLLLVEKVTFANYSWLINFFLYIWLTVLALTHIFFCATNLYHIIKIDYQCDKYNTHLLFLYSNLSTKSYYSSSSMELFCVIIFIYSLHNSDLLVFRCQLLGNLEKYLYIIM